MTALYLILGAAGVFVLGYLLGHGHGFECGYTEAVEAQKQIESLS